MQQIAENKPLMFNEVAPLWIRITASHKVATRVNNTKKETWREAKFPLGGNVRLRKGYGGQPSPMACQP